MFTGLVSQTKSKPKAWRSGEAATKALVGEASILA